MRVCVLSTKCTRTDLLYVDDFTWVNSSSFLFFITFQCILKMEKLPNGIFKNKQCITAYKCNPHIDVKYQNLIRKRLFIKYHRWISNNDI